MITVVLELGCERIVYDAEDWREALAIASNRLSMQELRQGWTLRIEEGGRNLRCLS